METEAPLLQTRNNDFNLYPNPASGRVQVDYTTTQSGVAEFRILNLLGKTARVQKQQAISGYNQVTIDISSLEPGSYFVQMITSEGIRIKKMIILDK